MSVFTPLEHDQLEAFLKPYGLGRLQRFQGIAGGSENSNFFVSTDTGEYVLTLVERGEPGHLPFLIQLLERLHAAELPIPHVIAPPDGVGLRELAGKPALLQPRLPGRHIEQPNPQHCREVGRLLARMHLATHEDILEWRSDRGLDWMLEQKLELDDEQLRLVRTSLVEIGEHSAQLLALPRANLHADLFRDNLLFEGNHLSGVIDFHNACSGPMLYDLAIACNDWCSHADGRLDPARSEALLAGYSSLRHFSSAEANLWPTMLRIACLRFWLSRLLAEGQAAGPEVLVKPAEEFRQRLLHRQGTPSQLPFAF